MVFPKNKITTVFIGLGSNLGDRSKNLETALKALGARKDIKVEKVSSFKESKPHKAAGPDFLNAVAKIKTSLSPKGLLKVMQQIENSMGRTRSFKNAPRIIDLDMLLYGQEILNEADLILPHPDLKDRDFVIAPLLEIEPDLASSKLLFG